MVAAKVFDTEYLEDRVTLCSREAGIKAETWDRFLQELDGLKEHNAVMYTHSLRVGLYCFGLAKAEGQKNLRFPLFAGCGHDIGKRSIANSLLDAEALRPGEFDEIKLHATKGYEQLKDSFLFTGLVAGLHHKYQADGYGIDLELDAPLGLSKGAKASIKAMAQLVMITDFFDALTTRNNNRGFVRNPDDPIEQREVMLRHFPSAAERISWLVGHRI